MNKRGGKTRSSILQISAIYTLCCSLRLLRLGWSYLKTVSSQPLGAAFSCMFCIFLQKPRHESRDYCRQADFHSENDIYDAATDVLFQPWSWGGHVRVWNAFFFFFSSCFVLSWQFSPGCLKVSWDQSQRSRVLHIWLKTNGGHILVSDPTECNILLVFVSVYVLETIPWKAFFVVVFLALNW